MEETKQQQTTETSTAVYSTATMYFKRINTLINEYTKMENFNDAPYYEHSKLRVLDALCSEVLAYCNVHARGYVQRVLDIRKGIANIPEELFDQHIRAHTQLGKQSVKLFEQLNLLIHSIGLIVPIKNHSEEYAQCT